MKKFGFKKDKGGEADDDDRGRLFGKSKSKSPAPHSNPYAVSQSSSTDPYAKKSSSNPYANAAASPDPYSQSQTSLATQPPPYERASVTNSYSSEHRRNDKSPVPHGGASAYSNGGTYGAARGYGGASSSHDQGSSNSYSSRPGGNANAYTSGNYGAAREYGGASYAPSSSQDQRPGGYGGLGRSYSQDTIDTQAGREALFGGARERHEQQAAKSQLPPEEDPAQASSSGTIGAMDMGYGTYQDRQLTVSHIKDFTDNKAEEQEEEEVQATKQQIRQLKQQDVASTRNALRIAAQAEQTGRETLERLGVQGEMIHNTEKNLDLAANQNRLAEEKAKELKHLNRSMFAVRVTNPLTKSARDRDRDDAIIEKHHYERMEREATRAAAYESQARRDEASKNLKGPTGAVVKKAQLSERSKYQFEADSDDEAMEDEIDTNLDTLSKAAGRLNLLGKAMGREVDSQNQHIMRIAGKADRVDDQIVMNRGRLDRIK